jgi:iron complex outermembrane receptor protein
LLNLIVNRYFAFLFLLLAPSVTAAQSTGSIHGTITDASTQSAVAAARVMLVGAHLEELSHTDGKFHFDRVPVGRHVLRIERLGYAVATQEIEVKSGALIKINFPLAPSALEVTALMVTGVITRRSADEMIGSTTALHGQQLDRNANSTVAAMVESQPGVAVSSIGPATARPIIRGLGGDRILLLEDGQRTGDMSATSGDHAVAIEPLTASQIEIVRGPMSLLYGSSAMGGVVNVVKHDIPESLPEHPYGQFSLEAASAQPGAAGGGSMTSRVGPVAARLEGSARIAGDLNTPTGSLTNTDLNTYNAAFGLGGGGEWGHAGGSYRFYTNNYGIPGGYVGGHAEGVTIDMRRHTLRGESEFHRTGSTLSSVKLSALGTKYRHTEMENSGEIGTLFEQLTTSAEAIARIEPVDSHVTAAFGVRGQYRDITTGGSLRTPSTRDYTLATYAISEFGSGATRFQAGARYDWARYEPQEESSVFVGGQFVPTGPRSFGSFSGSLGVLHEVTDGVRIGASVSRAYRTPDFNELYSNGPHLAANSYDVGDPQIDQETGIGGDIFLRGTGDQVRYDVAIFFMHLDNYIFPSSRGRAELGTQGARPRFQFTNEDAHFLGAEAQVTVKLSERFSIEATTSYVQAEFASDRDSIPIIATDTTFMPASKNPPLIPPLNGRAGLRYQESRRSAGVEVKWATEATRLGDFETATPAYAVVNLDAGVQLLIGGRLHSVTARIDNALDTEYRNHLSRIKDLMAQPGRNFALLYRVTI